MMLDTVDGPVAVVTLGSRDIENCPRSMFEIRIGLDSKPGTVESLGKGLARAPTWLWLDREGRISEFRPAMRKVNVNAINILDNFCLFLETFLAISGIFTFF